MKRRIDKERVFSAMLLVCCLLLGLVWVFDTVYRIFRNFSDKEIVCIDERCAETETETATEKEMPLPEKEPEQIAIREANLGLAGLPAGYATERKTEETIYQGMLAYAENIPPAENLADFKNKNEYYHLKNMKLKIQEPAVTAMNALADAYFQETGRSDLLVYSTSELYDVADSMYSDFLPDRSTGFCLDLAFLNEDGTISGINAENAAWLKENAVRFGFVFSVPELYYHIHYVGSLHAAVMQKEHLTLPEYLEALKTYTVSEPYQYHNENHDSIIYFVPAAAFGYTEIPFPECSHYQVSGNGKDGYIVQADMNYE